ncbi:hypothetical protein INT45_007791 [Circinella minor]|uniref:Peptidase A1 domain-containing protein n=1 Tax=Circinella minor TaxID=1195481 RepID=A0A8H7RYQ9_9FUNG|nr:hypothetical protein INT45_007791 [Circinella minor]
MVNAISIDDMIFKTPEYIGDKPPSIPLLFQSGVPTAKFSIGTPPQNFTGIFDTGSPITWALSSECRDHGCTNVPISEKFNQKASNTNSPIPTEIDLHYLDGTHVQLKPELDTVTLAKQFQFPRHLIGEVTMIEYPAGFVPAATGDAHTSTGPATSGSPNFRKKRGFPTSAINFLWVLGNDPSMYTGPLYKLDLISAADSGTSPFWKVPLKGLSFKNQEFKLSGGSYGTISSSTPYIMVPPSVAGDINNAIGAHYNEQSRMYTISCSARDYLKPLVIEFSQGLNAVISAIQYINEFNHPPTDSSQQEDQCFSTIVNGPDDHTIYLGGPFFRSYYLGFAITELQLNIAQSVVNTGATLATTSSYNEGQQADTPQLPAPGQKEQSNVDNSNTSLPPPQQGDSQPTTATSGAKDTNTSPGDTPKNPF